MQANHGVDLVPKGPVEVEALEVNQQEPGKTPDAHVLDGIAVCVTPRALPAHLKKEQEKGLTWESNGTNRQSTMATGEK
tara:strand:+ start:177 stop:413 length:237 start_codon:yes stop_codon:yes gene_type:complete